MTLGLAGCEGTTLDAFELTGRVSVFESSTDAPVPGARVIFTSDTLLVEETVADDDGRYRMRVLSDHPFGQVRAEAEGFRPAERTVYFDQQRRRIDLRMRSMPE